MRRLVAIRLVIVFTILISSVAETYGQERQSLSLEQRVVALEAENARLQTLVKSLLERVLKIESRPSSDGSPSITTGQGVADGFLGKWDNKNDPTKAILTEIIITKEGDNVFVRIVGNDLKGKYLAQQEKGMLAINLPRIGVSYVAWIEKGKKLNAMGEEFERIGDD